MFTVQKMEKKNKVCSIFAGVHTIVGLILIVIVKVFAPVCTGMVKLESGSQSFMKCHYTGQILLYFGILLMVSGIFAFLTKQFAAVGMIGCVLGSFMILVTTDTSLGIGVCANAEMACNLTAGLARILGAVTIIIGICSTVKGLKR